MTPQAKSKGEIESSAQRPEALTVNPDGVPEELRARTQWVAWQYERRKEKAGKWKWTKVPINPHTGRRASSTDPRTWTTFDDALAYYRAHQLAGVGFVFSKPTEKYPDLPDDPFAGVDLDDAFDSETVTVAEWAIPILDALDSYTEVSPSGTGTKTIIRARKDGERCEGYYQGHKVEVYDHGRFFALTGAVLAGMPTEIRDRQNQLDKLYGRLFGQPTKSNQKQRDKPTGERIAPSNGDGHSHTLGDDEILRLANSAANADKFCRLWAGDTSGHNDDSSRADCALCTILAFYTRDEHQIDRLFRQCGLFRPKWDEPRGSRTYGERTIDTALEYQQDRYEPRKAKHTAGGSEDGQTSSSADQSGYHVILNHFRERYQPVFRRGTSIYAGTLGREVRISEACCAPGIELVEKLLLASDAPRDRKGHTDRALIPGFFWTWAKTAWVDLQAELPEEEQAAEISDPALEEFRDAVAAAMHTIVAMGHQYRSRDGDERIETQRRSLIDWCRLWAKPAKWGQIRSYALWVRKHRAADGSDRLRIALRIDLFGQINHALKCGQRRFGALAVMYGIGIDDKAFKVCGNRALELTPQFIEHLATQPGQMDERTDGGDSRARAREEETSKRPKEG
jgi:primase-polymerase (primpol)-like protein